MSEQVMVYPNPTSGIVKVDFAVNNVNPISIIVANLVGAHLAEYTYGGGFGSMTLDLAKYGQGAYMIHIVNQKEVATKKIIVTK